MRYERAFGKIELAAIIVLLFLVVSIVIPMSGPGCGLSRAEARRLKDSTQIRNIVQAFALHGLANADIYPMPSRLDRDDATISGVESLASKDITGQILSVLIWNGSISTELCVSPAEGGDVAMLYSQYEYDQPKHAANPRDALWDPGFRGTPLSAEALVPTTHTPEHANQSYAMSPARDARLSQWSNTFAADEAIVANRGPEYTKKSGKWKLVSGATGTSSRTLPFHKPTDRWAGNVGFNDGHVRFETTPTPDAISYRTLASATAPDNLFADETDEVTDTGPASPAERVNAYLRPWATMDVIPQPWID